MTWVIGASLFFGGALFGSVVTASLLAFILSAFDEGKH